MMNIYERNRKDEGGKKEEIIKGQAQLWKHMYAFVETIVLRCAVQLGIPDLIHEQGPMTLHELANKLPIDTINMQRFHQTMRYMVHMNLFSVIMANDDEVMVTKYGLTPASKLLLKHDNNKISMASYVMLLTEPDEFSIAGKLVESLGSGTKTCWELFYGIAPYEKMEKDSELNKMMIDAMSGSTMCMVQAFVEGLMRENVLEDVTSLVEVGGNTGDVAKAILSAFPHLKCTVMDLLHVIQSVPKVPQLDFVAGDMFHSIPNADVVLLKSVLHNYEDDKCIKILNKCKEAIGPTKIGKVILVEIVVDIENMPEFSTARLGLEMDMMFMGGKERSKKDWENLFYNAGYSYHRIIPIAAVESIIVVYP